MGSIFLLPLWANAVLFALAVGFAGWEWGGFMGLGAANRRRLGLGFALLCCLLYWSGMLPRIGNFLLLFSLLFWGGLVPFWLRRRWTISPLWFGLSTGFLVIVPTWVALLFLLQRSPWLLLFAMSLVWVADIAAYAAGKACGRHKLAPSISPGKTREGAAGALLAVVAYGVLVSACVPAWPPLAYPWLGAGLCLITASSIVGDLFESLLKRQIGLKDSSQLLPGHGGILDRIDSQTSTLPLVAFFVYAMSR